MSIRTTAPRALAGVAALALALSACSSSKSGTPKPAVSSGPGANAANANTVNSGKTTGTGSATWTIEKHIDSWNTLTNAGNTFDFGQALNPIYPTVFIINPDYSITLNTDMMVSAEQASTSPLTIVYKIKPEAKWSDGEPISADDFILNWKAQNGVDQNFDVAGTTGYEDIASVDGSDGGKTVTVKFKDGKIFSDWKSLFGTLLPAHLVKNFASPTTEKTDDPKFTAEERYWNVGAQVSYPKVSGGPFVIDSVSADGLTVIEKRNPNYYGAKANLDQLTFKAIEDSTQEPLALKNGDVDGMYPQPTFDLVNQLKSFGPNYTVNLNSGLTFEHLDMNMHNTYLGNKDWGTALRTAMFTATSREKIIGKTIKQFYPDAKPLNSRFLVQSQKGYEDNLTAAGLGAGDLAKAKAGLTAAKFTWDASGNLMAPDGTAVPHIRLRFKGNQTRQDTCDEFARQMKDLGITVDVTKSDSLGKLIQQKGDAYQWDMILFAWVSSPFISGNISIYHSLPAGAADPQNDDGWYGNTQVDDLLTKAGAETDYDKAVALYNQADKIISKDAYSLPLYQKPTMIAYKNTLVNVRDNTTSIGPTYNAGQWGIKAAS
jgi:peptide/nickel transport system substrate-binding protein